MNCRRSVLGLAGELLRAFAGLRSVAAAGRDLIPVHIAAAAQCEKGQQPESLAGPEVRQRK